MRKLLLLLFTLLTSVSTAWAATYTIVNGTDLPSSLGSFSLSGSGYYCTYSSNALSGLTVTSDGYLMKEGSSTNADYGKCFVVSSGPVQTAQISINAPSGYTIAGYTIKGKGGNGGVTFSIKGSDGTTKDLAALTYDGITVSGLCSTTETITITSNTANKEIWFNTLTVDLVAGTPLSVIYKVRYNNATVHTTSSVSTCVGTKPLLPALDTRGYCTYKYFSDEACESEITTLAAENAIVYAKCTLSDAPFEFATSVEDANTNNKWKEFKLADKTHYVYYNGSTLAYDATDLSTTDGYQWALIGNPYGYKIYNKEAEKYLKASVPTTNTSTTNDFSFDNEGLTWELYRYYSSNNNDHFVSVVSETNTNVSTATVLNYSNGWKIWCGKNNTAGFYCNNGRMNGLSTSYLLPFDVPSTFIVTYNINNYAGTQVDTGDAEVAAGDTGDDAANHLPSALRKDGCTYTYSPTTVSESNNVITVTFTYDPGFGFDVYNNYAGISTWQFLKRNNNDYIVYDSGSTPNVQRSTALPDGDNASWAFVGNPYEGIKIYNKGAGSSVWLTSATPNAEDGTTGGGGNTAVTLASSGDKQVWFLSESTYFTNGFFIGNNDGYKLNGRSSSKNVAYWMGGADGGSTFMTIENADYHENVVSELASWFTDNVDKYFGLSQTTYDAQNANYTSYSSAATYKQYMELKAAVEAGIKYPATGNYLVKNLYTNNYMKFSSDRFVTSAGIDFNAIVHLTDNDDGTYSFALQGKYIGEAPKNLSGYAPTSDTPYNYTWEIPAPGYVSLQKGSTGVYLWCAGTVTGWVGGNQGSKWTVEDVSSVSINLTAANDNSGTAHTYATLCVPFNITGLTGVSSKEVKAYAPTKSGDYIVPGTGATTVTEGTPVLLIGEEGATSVTATIGSNYASSPVTSDVVLTGTFTGATIDCSTESNNYVLGFDSENDNRIGFYHVSEGSSFALGANRAYLKLDNNGDPTHVKGFVISFDEDEETGINSIENGKLKIENEAVYDLSGRRIAKPTKGLYIVNGKKVVIK